MKPGLFILLLLCSAAYAEPYSPDADGSMYSANGAVVKPAPTNALYEMMRRLEQLQAEVQRLTGRVEEQAYLIAEMKKAQTTLYSDFDERMQALEKKAETIGASALGNLQRQENIAADPNEAVPEEGAHEAMAATDPELTQPLAQKTGVKQAPVSNESPAPSGDERQLYQQAYDALRNGHTAQAITQFNVLLSKNPKGDTANNAMYWLGEAYRVNQDIDSARQTFNRVVESPGSAKAPDALLKLGIIEVEQKNTAKAREYLTRVTADFPGSTAARLAAKKLLLLDDVKQ